MGRSCRFFVIDHDEYEKARKGKDWSSFYFDSKMEGDYRVGMQELGYRGLTKIPCLIYHLIREHGFFEGSVFWRCVPEAIVQRFGVERVPGSIQKAAELKIENFA